MSNTPNKIETTVIEPTATETSVDEQAAKQRVVVIGGGFGGLYAVQALQRAPVQITLIDKRNFHLFQPLLYQVATGGLSPGDIASPLRAVLKRQSNVTVVAAEVTDIDPVQKQVILAQETVAYDTLLVASGMTTSYFGNAEWQARSPGLKSMEDALEIRRRILLAFETAERESNSARQSALMTFVLVGGGPTGVELSGAIAELAYGTLENNFRHIDPANARIVLLEGDDRLLPPYPPKLSARAQRSLERMGVEVITGARVTAIEDDKVRYQQGDESLSIESQNIFWAAGLKATALIDALAERTGATQQRDGRIVVEPDLTIPGHPDIFVVGDAAYYAHTEDETPLPGIAPVAMQEGKYVAKVIAARQRGESTAAFTYSDKGKMAVIGRNAAVADLGFMQFGGFFAWLSWLFIHIWYLVEFDNKLIVMLQWAWNYFTRKRGARLIVGDNTLPEPAYRKSS